MVASGGGEATNVGGPASQMGPLSPTGSGQGMRLMQGPGGGRPWRRMQVAIRVLHIIGQLGVGGCETQLLGLCRRMDRSRFTLGVCHYAPNPDHMTREFEEAGVKVYYVNKFGGISRWRYFQTLRGFIRDFKPDVIHTWQYSSNWWGRMAGRTCGCKRFVSSDRTARPGYKWYWRCFEAFMGRRTRRLAIFGGRGRRGCAAAGPAARAVSGSSRTPWTCPSATAGPTGPT